MFVWHYFVVFLEQFSIKPVESDDVFALILPYNALSLVQKAHATGVLTSQA